MTRKRSVYLEDLPLEEATARLYAALDAAGLGDQLPGEMVPLAEALGRVTAASVWAVISAPHYHASAMDGYAVRSRDTRSASETSPVTLTEIDDDSAIERVERPAMPLNTGNALPLWADAVIMIENVQKGTERGDLVIRSSVAPWQHIRAMGEDMIATELVLPANHTLRPVDLGAIAGSGHASVSVRHKPRVAIIPTGSELVSADDLAPSIGVGLRPTLAAAPNTPDQPAPGQNIEFNSLVLAAQIEAWGGAPTRWPIIPDSYDAIRAAVLDAAQSHDLVLVNAGSSAGSEDYTAQIIRDLGQLLVHGVAVRPGHPVIFGLLASPSATPVIGVPGYPVSAALTGEIFIEPLIKRWLGQPPTERLTLNATISRKVMSPTGDDDFIRVSVGQVGDRVIATPLNRGAGVISSLVRADGLVHIPRFSEGLDAGTPVTVHLYRTPAEIARTLVHIGSHDMTLDLLSQFLAERPPNARLSSANVGSLGGLVALKRGEAHFAGAHLLDPETGTYNWKYIDQYLPDRDVVLITLVHREQGLIVSSGNPKHIKGFEDLPREDVRYVNRQRGAGTRILLDYDLALRGINAAKVRGYEREEYTHLAVAAAIASGTADAGLGVRAAASALKLDFVPVGWERYDLVIPREHHESPILQPLLSLLEDAAFREAVSALKGYNVSKMGNRVER
jgi:putative molybdopterin biosynthesis protein